MGATRGHKTYHDSVKGVAHHGDKHAKSHDHHKNNVKREVDCAKDLCSREGRVTNFNIFCFKETDQQPEQTKKRIRRSKNKKLKYGIILLNK